MFNYYLFGRLGAISPIYVVYALALERLDNWQLRKDVPLDYSNQGGRIASFGQTNKKITGKVFQARLLDGTGLMPDTWIIENGKMKALSQNKIENDKVTLPAVCVPFTKFFLKPDHSSRGRGIHVLSNLSDYKKIVGNRSYVLQRGVENILLYKGHKFDLRIWIHMVYKKNEQYEAWLHMNGGYLRIARPLYSDESREIGANITNNSWHDKNPATDNFYITDLWHTQEFYQATFPKVEAMAIKLFEHLRQQWKKPIRYSGFEVIGLDILIDQEYKPHLLEFNRHLGYPLHRTEDKNYNPVVRELTLKVTQDLIQDFVEPMLKNEPYKPRNLWRPISFLQKA